MLPHQIDAFIDQVDEVILVLDTHRSKGRFGSNWDENLTNIKALIDSQSARHEKIRLAEVDYSQPAMTSVANYFFGTDFIPEKDYRGGPFYAYFYGLLISRSTFVFHLDSDIFIGGRSQGWIQEALQLFSAHDRLLTCSPLPGPPHPEGVLIGQPYAQRLDEPYFFRFPGMSTRIFMIDLSFFKNHKLRLSHAHIKNAVKAFIKKHPPYNLPEDILSEYMRSMNLSRVDFLGAAGGMWSLHPPYRNELFYCALPKLLVRVNENDLHPKQNGFYDIVDEVCDWTDAKEKLKKNRWWKKLPYAKNHK